MEKKENITKKIKKSLDELKAEKLAKIKKIQTELKLLEKKENDKKYKEIIKDIKKLDDEYLEKIKNIIQEFKNKKD